MSYQPFPRFVDWPVLFSANLVDQYAERLDRVRQSATPEARERALTVATRYAAVDTGAIEGLYTTDRGFTKTIATQAEHWQRALDVRGEHVKRSIQDALDAYEYVLDAVTGAKRVTAQWIRQLHAVITAHQHTYTVVVEVNGNLGQEQRPLPHGEYKTLPNNPTSTTTGRIHDYAPPMDTAAEMIRLCDELASAEFMAAHPVVQAAYAHYAYVCIHPFADGNGRVARALASVFLYHRPGVPLVIFADQRDSYVDALEAADALEPNNFVDFITQRVIDTVQLVQLTMDAPSRPSIGNVDQEITHRASVHQVKLAASRLATLACQHLRQAICSYDLPDAMSPVVNLAQHDYQAFDGFERGAQDNKITISVSDGGRILASDVFLALARTSVPELLLRSEPDDDAGLDVWLREIDPSETTGLNLKLDAWANNVAARFVAELSKAMPR
ncbi:MAG: Fic family protein [Propionibacteriaceae bacterium]|nr:Fic family protein [Propionibacteriaceae bacterium]